MRGEHARTERRMDGCTDGRAGRINRYVVLLRELTPSMFNSSMYFAIFTGLKVTQFSSG